VTDGANVDVDEQLVRQLTERARADGLKLTGEGGLLQRLTKLVVESSLEGELDDHLGYGKHDPAGRDGGNSRNGKRAKTLLTEAGPVAIEVPRDREGSFEPKIVAKRQRRLSGVDDLVISLSAKGLTHGEISAHLAEIYGAEVSKQTISTITDRVVEGMAQWQSRPLDPVYPVIFIDCVNVKIRDGQVANRPIYVALAVTVEGTREILGLWAGEHGDGEGAKFWLRVLSEIKNRGTTDCCIVVCDGLKGLPDTGRDGVAGHDRANVYRSLAAQQFPLCVQKGLVGDREGPQTGLHRAVGAGRAGPVRRVQREVGETLPGDHPAVDQRLGRVRPVPAVRPGHPHGHLHHQRDREHQRPHPARRQRPRTLPERASRADSSGRCNTG
jgi:putative transposase